MSIKNLKNFINEHINTNIWLYVISIICIFAGAILGIYSVKYMGSFEKTDLTSYISNFGSTLNSGALDYKNVFMQTLKNNLSIILGIWFLGLTMVGVPIILILDIFKGFTLGFSTCFMINQMGLKGLWISLLGILPQNLIYIPIVVIASVLAMEFSLTIFRDKNQKPGSNPIAMRITSYSFIFVIIVFFMFIGFFTEAYLTPNLVKFVITSLGSVML